MYIYTMLLHCNLMLHHSSSVLSQRIVCIPSKHPALSEFLVILAQSRVRRKNQNSANGRTAGENGRKPYLIAGSACRSAAQGRRAAPGGGGVFACICI